MGSECKTSHLEHVEGQRPTTLHAPNLHSCRRQGTTVPFGTTVLEATHQKFSAKEREASEDCSSSTEGSRHRCCRSAAESSVAHVGALRWGSVWEPPLMTFFDENRSPGCGGNLLFDHVKIRQCDYENNSNNSVR